MIYSQFEDELLLKIGTAADTTLANNPYSRGQIDIVALASEAFPQVSQEWVRGAVTRFKDHGWIGPVVEALSGATILELTGEGRRKINSLG